MSSCIELTPEVVQDTVDRAAGELGSTPGERRLARRGTDRRTDASRSLAMADAAGIPIDPDHALHAGFEQRSGVPAGAQRHVDDGAPAAEVGDHLATMTGS